MLQPETSALSPVKKDMIENIIRFLKVEASSCDPDKKESIEVAIQCIELAFDIASVDTNYNHTDELHANSFGEELNAEIIRTADAHKDKGNDLMRQGLFDQAAEEYTRAIELNPNNAVYYCNRAATSSRLENDKGVVDDCLQAVKLDPNYAKAYGRLGIAYSNLNQFKEARDAYLKAVQLDPSNIMYQENYKLAAAKALASQGTDFDQFLSDPNILNVATQMLNDTRVVNALSGFLETRTASENQGVDALLVMGEQLAHQIQMNNPSFASNLRHFAERTTPGGNNPPNQSGNGPNRNPPSNGDKN